MNNVTTYYAELVTGQYVPLFSDNAGLGQIPADYKLDLRAGKWTVSTVTFSGSWVLDAYLLN